MKSFKFNDQEIELVLNLYQSELEEAENYIKQIKSFLNKIEAQDQKVEPKSEVKIQNRRGPKPKVVKEETVHEVIKKERKKRTVKTNLVKPEMPGNENIVIPVPVRKEPTLPIVQEPLTPVQPILTETAPPPPLQFPTVSTLNIPVFKEERKIDVAPLSPPIMPKPFFQTPYPNNQYGKKKKFRPKRPRIELKNPSKPVHVKVEIGRRQFGENQEMGQ